MKKLLHTLALGFLFCLLAADAAALTVTNAGNAGGGSLRQAIADVPNGGTIDFDAGVDGQTIALTSELTVNKPVIIDASSLSAGVTISGGSATRIFSVTAAGNLTLRSLTLTGGNGASATLNTEGGALHNAGIATIERCTLSGNTSTSNGGAIRNDGTLTLTQCTLSGNSAAAGGAIANFSAGALTLTHCTISGNSAANQGGGLNISGVVAMITNSIVSGNAATTGSDIWSEGPSGGVLRVGANLIGSAAKTPNAPDSGPAANTANPLLGPLDDNGGLTETMALLAYSQAIDGVPADAIVAGLDTDQRGDEFARSLGGGPDIGAYESGDAAFTDDGLTLFARLQAALIGTGVVFEVSTTADFLVVNPLVSTLAGTPGVFGATDGTRLSATFKFPSGLAQDSLGNIFIADAGSNVIRMLGTDGVVSTIAGSGIYGMADGPGLNAAFRFPSAVAVGPDDNVYVSDTFNHRICKLTRPPSEGQPWTVARLSGTGSFGFLNGNGSVARFYYPYGLDLDELGNVYVADALNHRIRKVAPDGSTSTFAGSGDEDFVDSATAATAAFNTPQGVVIVAKAGDPAVVYVADRNNHSIRSISTTSNAAGLVATEVKTMAGTDTSGFANGTGTAARFNSPSSVAADSDGNLYVSDEENHRVRRVTPGIDVTIDGVVSTVAGTGDADFLNGLSTVARFNAPAGLLRSRDGSVVVADAANHVLRRIAIGPLRVPAIADPSNVDDAGTLISAVIDMAVLGLDPNVRYYFRYRLDDDITTQALGQSFIQIPLPTVVTGVADNLTPTAARLRGTVNAHNLPTSAVLEYSTDPNLLPPLRVATLAGAGIAEPVGVAITGTVVLVADRANHRILKIDASGAVTTFVGSGVPGFVNGTGTAAQFDHPSGIVAEPDVVLADGATTFGLTTVTCASTVGLAPGASISGTNIAAGATIVSVTNATQFVISIAATGTSTGLTLTAGGAHYYVADEFNHCIRKITANGQVTTLSGSGVAGFADGAAGVAKFLFPTGVALDGDNVYVADSANHRIRTVAPDGTAATLSGTGVSGFADGAAEVAQFASPRAVAVNADGEVLVADTGNHVIRVIADGMVETFSGSTQGFADGLAASAKFDSPSGLAVAADGTTYVSDAGNHRVRIIDENGDASTLAGSGVAGAVNSPVSGLYPVSTAQFNLPAGIAVDATGRVLVTQEGLVRSIARGTLPAIVWPAVITGSADTMIFGDIGGLLPGTTYYYRAKGTCLQATITGAILSLTTVPVPIAVFDGANTAAPAVLNGQTTTIDFGTTPRGTPVARQFTIFNPNGRNITVTAINVPTGYQVTVGGGVNVIEPAGMANDTLTFEVTLLANNGGTIAGNIVINSDAPGLPAFSFPITAVVLDFPTVSTLAATAVQGDTATLNATVNPKGSDTTVWFQWSLTGQFDGALVSTLAGSSPGFAAGVGAAAQFDQPHGVAIDAGGNVFVADTKNHRIRRIAPDGTVTVFAGTGDAGFADGPGADAQFNEPVGLCFGANGTLFVADSKNHRIRAISLDGVVSTYSGVLGLPGFTDGVVSGARFNTPWGLAIDVAGVLYVADRDNHRIRTVATDGSVSTLAGTGDAGSANGAFGVGQFDRPLGVAVDRAGFVYVTETASHAIRRLTLDGTVSNFAGSPTTAGLVNGTPAAARFSSPVGLGVDVTGALFVADKGNHCVRQIASTSVSGVVSTSVVTFAGLGTAGTTDGLKDVAQFDSPISVAATAERGAIVGELTQATIRKIEPTEPLLLAATGLTGTADLSVSLIVTGLVIGDTYHYRAVATNARGTNYGTARSVLAGTPFELWQLANFDEEATNPAIAGPDADPKHDGITNRFKYALGLDPNIHTINGLPLVAVNGAALTITYNKTLAATDIAYTVEWSTDLTTWNTAGISEQVFPDNGISQQIIASIPITPDRIKFLRLTITFLTP